MVEIFARSVDRDEIACAVNNAKIELRVLEYDGAKDSNSDVVE